jgi:hypothetical protein
MPLFRYQYPFLEARGSIAGPYLPVTIINPVTEAGTIWNCLIDTGADQGVFGRFLAESLGHNLKGDGVKSSITSGVEGREINTWCHSFKLQLLHPTNKSTVIWQSRKQLIECLEHDNCPQILGVKDFLNNFKITIDYPHPMTTLEWSLK